MTAPAKGALALLDLTQAARLLGVGEGTKRPDEVLLRLLEKKENATGHQIMTRLGGSGRGVRYRVTLTAIRDYCPEFFSKRDEMAEVLKEQFEALEDRIAELYQRDSAIAREIAGIKETIRVRLGSVRFGLARFRSGALAGPTRPRGVSRHGCYRHRICLRHGLR